MAFNDKKKGINDPAEELLGAGKIRRPVNEVFPLT